LKCVAKEDFLKKCQADNIKVSVPNTEIEESAPANAPAATAGAKSGPAPSTAKPNTGTHGGPRPPLPSNNPGGAPAPRGTGAPAQPAAGGGSFFDKFKKPGS
jgi:hypothetical protein